MVDNLLIIVQVFLKRMLALIYRWDIETKVCDLDSVMPLYIEMIIIKVFASGPGDLGSITGQVIPKTQKNGIWC